MDLSPSARRERPARLDRPRRGRAPPAAPAYARPLAGGAGHTRWRRPAITETLEATHLFGTPPEHRFAPSPPPAPAGLGRVRVNGAGPRMATGNAWPHPPGAAALPTSRRDRSRTTA